MRPVVVLGSLNMDLVVRTARLPGPGETVLGSDFRAGAGGKGANQAVAAARAAGGGVVLVGRVGDDAHGEALRKSLRAAGVSDAHVVTDPGAPSGVALIAVEDSGQNQIVVYPGANGRVGREDVDRAQGLLAGAAALVAQLEVPVETVAHALALARSAGTPTILNPAPALPLDPGLLADVDYLIPNETEAALLAGLAGGRPDRDRQAREAARRLRGLGARHVVVTLGERGALWCAPDGEGRVEAFPVQAVDTTAAGDAFVGALAVALAEGRGLAEAVRAGCAAGALAATRPGAQPSLPLRAEIDALLKGGPVL